MKSDRVTIFICLAAAATALGVGSMFFGPINQLRSELKLTVSEEQLKALPPGIAWRQAALGSFRGLAVDVLWMRANQLKQEGKFHEAMQLSRWITQLQPRFEQVWLFHAWNMAYNISVMTKTEQERWLWVREGIRLLRDEGIPLNPRAPLLYKELAWIFVHKIGDTADEKHWYYKKELAAEWHELLGPPPIHPTAAEVRSGNVRPAGVRFVDWLTPIEEMDRLYLAPAVRAGEVRDPLAVLMAAEPDVAAQVETVLGLIRQFAQDPAQVKLDRRFLKLVAVVQNRVKSEDNPNVVSPIFGRPEYLFDATRAYVEVGNWIQSPEVEKPRQRLLSFLRARVLREEYHMDPAWMLSLTKGEWFVPEGKQPIPLPLDWRHPAVHGLYWSSKGVALTRDYINVNQVDILNTDRQVVHAMQALAREGIVQFDPLMDYYETLPQTAFIEPYIQTVLASYERLKTEEKNRNEDSSAPETFMTGLEFFLKDSVLWSYYAGERQEARRYQEMLRDRFGKDEQRQALYAMALPDFVREVLYEEIKDMALLNLDQARPFLLNILHRYLEEGILKDQELVRTEYWGFAKAFWDKYQQGSVGAAVKEGETRGRTALPPLDDMLYEAFERYMLNPRIYPMYKVRLWMKLPADRLWLAQKAYARFQGRLKPQATSLDLLGPGMLFAPPGWEKFIEAAPPRPTNQPGPLAPLPPLAPGPVPNRSN